MLMIIDNRVLTAALAVFSDQLRASAELHGTNFEHIEAVQDIIHEVNVLKAKLAYRSDKLSITDVKVLLPGEKSPSN